MNFQKNTDNVTEFDATVEKHVFDTLVFDMDGTLLDTLDDLMDSVNAALAARGYIQRSREEIREFVGNGVENLVRCAAPDGICEEEFQEVFHLFKAYYDMNKENKTCVYPGIIKLLESLAEEGYKTAVVSNKYHEAVQVLSKKYFGDLIQVSIGEGPDTARKPEPDGVLKAIKMLGSTPERTLYIGDSDVDIKTGRNAGVTTIGVLWGFRDQETLEATGADVIVDRPYKIWNYLVSKKDGIRYEPMVCRDYGDLKLDGGKFPFTYYNQGDSRWAAFTMGEEGSVADDGCGPAALAMALSSLLEKQILPTEIAAWVMENGHYCEGAGCYHRIVPEAAAHYGIPVRAIGTDQESLLEGLQGGKLAVALVKRGHFCPSGHFIVIRSITEGGKVLVGDPGSLNRSQVSWEQESVIGDLKETAGSGGPLWLLG